jgi:hypothetical protein
MWPGGSGAQSGGMFTHPEFTISLANEHVQRLQDESALVRRVRAARRSRRSKRSSPDRVIDLRSPTEAPPAVERARVAA